MRRFHITFFLYIFCISMGLGQPMSIYFSGDLNANPNLEKQVLAAINNKANANSALLLLGGILYPEGMCSPDQSERRSLELRLMPTLEAVKEFPGQAYMIPGEQAWANGRTLGLESIKNLETFVTDYTGDPSIFYPKNGCPGPEEIALNATTTLVLMDTQYLLHGYAKGREEEGCGAPGSSEALELFEEILMRNQDKHVIVAAHHPLFPNSSRKSIMAAGGKHTSGPRYQLVRKAILESIQPYENVVWINAHDYLLQHVTHEGNHFVTSGAGTQLGKIKSTANTQFVSAEYGFSELLVSDSGEVKLYFYANSGEVLYEEVLYKKAVSSREEDLTNRPDFSGQVKTMAASEQYEIGDGAKFWLGENYRTTWSTPVALPVFDISKEKGGLEVVKKGGGMQTLSIRLEAQDGTQFTLRSIEKDPKKILPRQVRNTFAADFLQDQISSSHPYGALAVPKLADAAGIYHTNPKIFYVPSDPAFGEYQFLVADKMFLFEERPTKEAAHEPFFGEGTKMKGTPDLLAKELYKDNDNWVDQQFVLKSRLFDMFIGDWDRHDDQWRWVGVKDDKGYRYRPVPRDRDQAFFVTGGVLPRIGASKWALPSSEGFDEEMDWAPGFNWNMRWFDRTFLTEPDWEDWQQAIDDLQGRISEEDMREAIRDLPDEVEGLADERIVEVLKVRLRDMEQYAREYYEYLSKEVEIVGSNKHEHFLVSRQPDGKVKVEVRKMTKEGELKQVLYDRTFDPKVTREIRLYGLDNDDVFLVRGEAEKSIKVRVIGGPGDDRIEDVSVVTGGGKKTIVYDTKETMEVKAGKETKVLLSNKADVNAYDRKQYKYNIFLPLVSLQYNADLGFFLGGGFFHQQFKWRKQPYAGQHLFLANGALNVRSYNFNYHGQFTEVFGKWGVDVKAQLQAPFFITNFFGLGNETEYDVDGETVATTEDPIDFYRINSDYGYYRLGTHRFLGSSQQHNLSFGAVFRSAKVEEDRADFLLLPESGVDIDKVSEIHLYQGADVHWITDIRNDKVFPTHGIAAEAKLEQLWGLNGRSEDLTRATGSFSLYNSLDPGGRIVLANRVGGEHIFQDDFEFFNSAQLGGWTNLRGFRRNRFSGQTSLYHNVDLRLKLFSFSTYIFPGHFGILAFHDTGRVWVDGESSSEWHFGRGVGAYITPLDMTAISVNWGITDEENLLIVKFGFFF